MHTEANQSQCHDHGIGGLSTLNESQHRSKGRFREIRGGANKALAPHASLILRQIKRTIFVLILSMSVVALSGCGSAEGCSKTGGGGRRQSCSCETGRYNCVIVNLALSFGLSASFALRRRGILRSV